MRMRSKQDSHASVTSSTMASNERFATSSSRFLRALATLTLDKCKPHLDYGFRFLSVKSEIDADIISRCAVGAGKHGIFYPGRMRNKGLVESGNEIQAWSCMTFSRMGKNTCLAFNFPRFRMHHKIAFATGSIAHDTGNIENQNGNPFAAKGIAMQCYTSGCRQFRENIVFRQPYAVIPRKGVFMLMGKPNKRRFSCVLWVLFSAWSEIPEDCRRQHHPYREAAYC